MLRFVVGMTSVVVFMIAIPVLLTWSASRRRLRVPRQEGAGGSVALLRMPRGHWAILSVIAFLPCSLISGLAFVAEWAPGAETNRWILGGVMALAAIVPAGYLLALELRGCLRVDERGVEKVGAFGSRRLEWGDVARVTFNPVSNWFFLTGPDGRTIYFAEGLDGIASFAEIAIERLPPAVLKACPEAAQALQEVAAF
jgi:hypothetical protein